MLRAAASAGSRNCARGPRGRTGSCSTRRTTCCRPPGARRPRRLPRQPAQPAHGHARPGLVAPAIRVAGGRRRCCWNGREPSAAARTVRTGDRRVVLRPERLPALAAEEALWWGRRDGRVERFTVEPPRARAPAAPAQVRRGRADRGGALHVPRAGRPVEPARREPARLRQDGRGGGRGDLAPPPAAGRLLALVPRGDQGRAAGRRRPRRWSGRTPGRREPRAHSATAIERRYAV